MDDRAEERRTHRFRRIVVDLLRRRRDLTFGHAAADALVELETLRSGVTDPARARDMDRIVEEVRASACVPVEIRRDEIGRLCRRETVDATVETVESVETVEKPSSLSSLPSPSSLGDESDDSHERDATHVQNAGVRGSI